MHFETYQSITYILCLSMFLFFTIQVYRWFRDI